MHQRGPEQANTHSQAGLAETKPREFFAKDQTLHYGGAAAAVFLWPTNSDPAAVVELFMPAHPRGPFLRAAIVERTSRERCELLIGLEPSADFPAKGLVFGVVIEIHRRQNLPLMRRGIKFHARP